MKLLFLATFVVLFSCCSKKNTSTNDTAPSNLAVSAAVNTDNSGNVSFTATATNAVSYDYDFGNGVLQTAASGSLIYKYPVSGTYTVNVTAKSSGGQTVSKSLQVTVTVILKLVWSDEFDTDGLPNTAKWGYDIGNGSNGWGNAELQYYTNRTDNAIVSGGVLKIIAKKENYSGSAYTSARLLSKDKYAFKYGKIEFRAKLPEGVGTWPATWLLGENISTAGWPASGEIDVMEHLGRELNKIYATVHYPGHSGGGGISNTRFITNATTAFHIYTLEWNAAELKFSVDGQMFHSVVNSNTLPFNQNFFIILNVAMGGNFGGTIDPAFNTAAMEIDYVRVYQ
jgi:beta-glucanase (GH16 family)